MRRADQPPNALVRQVPCRSRSGAVGRSTERLIAISIATPLVVLCGLGFVAPHFLRFCEETHSDIARATVKQYASRAYPSWRFAHPDQLCPHGLHELSLGRFDHVDNRDPWGTPYYFSCGDLMIPSGAKGIWVVSAGEDGEFGTDDDVRSDQ